MKSYPTYKNSGVEWIGRIPEHWNVTKLKYLLLSNDGGVWGEDPIDGEGTVVLRSTEVDLSGKWSIQEPAKRRLSETEIRKAVLRSGDLLITKSSGSQIHIGKTALVDSSVEGLRPCFSNFMQRLRPSDSADSAYLYYFLNSNIAREEYNYFSETTTGLANLSGQLISDLVAPHAPFTEQRAIATYLDDKTSKVDTLIGKKQRLNELLKEQRTAIINQAVTKGINPSVKMKHSGVEWIGVIPVHWKCIKFGGITQVMTCGVASTPDYFDEGVVFLSAQNIQNEKLDLSKFNYISEEFHNQLTKYTKPRKGDLLQVRVGGQSTIGQTCVVDVDLEFSIYVSLTHIRLQPYQENRYVKYLCNSSKFREYSSLVMKKGAGVANLNVADLEKMRITVPPYEEQVVISDYLDDKTKRIDESIQTAENQIDLLQEYRTALISEVVTGKIDVRDDVNGKKN